MMRCDMLLSANQRPDWASLEIKLIPGPDFRRHINDVGAIKDSRCNTSIQICDTCQKIG